VNSKISGTNLQRFKTCSPFRKFNKYYKLEIRSKVHTLMTLRSRMSDVLKIWGDRTSAIARRNIKSGMLREPEVFTSEDLKHPMKVTLGSNPEAGGINPKVGRISPKAGRINPNTGGTSPTMDGTIELTLLHIAIMIKKHLLFYLLIILLIILLFLA